MINLKVEQKTELKKITTLLEKLEKRTDLNREELIYIINKIQNTINKLHKQI